MKTVRIENPARKLPFNQCTDLIHGPKPSAESIDNRINFVFFDIETQQESGQHVPNLLISQTMYGEEDKQFVGKDCVVNFLNYLLDHHHKSTVVAHNLTGFDAIFLLETLLQHDFLPRVIMNGGKIMSMTLEDEKIRFVDSLNFLQVPLSSFPKMFGLRLPSGQGELAKGFFPHLFNWAENIANKYVGPMPPRNTYDADGMREETRAKFNEWYDEKVASNYQFDLMKELVDYCSLDVTILRLGVMSFCKEFQEMNGTNSLRHAVTLASICNAVYRADHMPKETIPYIPADGYRPRIRQSVKALRWLALLNRSTEWNGRIRHGRNMGEVQVPGMRGHVDGYDEQTRTCFEFNGCLWHGCLNCFSPETQSPYSRATMADLNHGTREKEAKLMTLGYDVITIWECEFDKQLRHDQDMKARVKQIAIVDTINPRDAFYGGRCEATKLYVKPYKSLEERGWSSNCPVCAQFEVVKQHQQPQQQQDDIQW